jgi:hypothetical protein
VADRDGQAKEEEKTMTLDQFRAETNQEANE